MGSFVIFNNDGGIHGTYTVSHVEDMAAVMAANTPEGCDALAVDGAHPVVANQDGWQVKDGALAAVVPTDADLLAAARATQLEMLTVSYNTAKTANVAYMATEFMADDESQQIFAHALVAYTALGATPGDFYVVDTKFIKVPMTLEQLKGLVAAIAAQVWAAFQRWVAVKEELASATSLGAVQSVIW